MVEPAVHEAEHLVVKVMEERGFPTANSAVRANALSVEDPALASAYRSAYQVFWLTERGAATPDRLVHAFTDYHEVVAQLLGRPRREASTSNTAAAAAQLTRSTEHVASR